MRSFATEKENNREEIAPNNSLGLLFNNANDGEIEDKGAVNSMLSSPVNQKNTSSDDDIANSLCSSLTEQEINIYEVYADNELSWDRTTSTINESVVKKYGVKASLIIFNKIKCRAFQTRHFQVLYIAFRW